MVSLRFVGSVRVNRLEWMWIREKGEKVGGQETWHKKLAREMNVMIIEGHY